MHKGRIEAFSDGVLAIIITIMVLELRPPRGAAWNDLRPVIPTLIGYMVSFVYVGIYWNNHHHMLQATRQVTGKVLCANLHLLFWLSLIPFVTGWAGQNHFQPIPTALYGVVLLMSGLAYSILQSSLIHAPDGNEVLAAAIGRDLKGKLSLALYTAAIGLSFVNRWIACAIYVGVALMWLIPDRRIESRLTEK